jgi:hypothetical protein
MSVSPLPLHTISFKIHYPLIVPSLGDAQSKIRAASLNKPQINKMNVRSFVIKKGLSLSLAGHGQRGLKSTQIRRFMKRQIL